MSSLTPNRYDSDTTFCPNCGNTVYYAEKVMFMKRLWHKSCLRCAKCNKVLDATIACGSEGKPYCPRPCYINLYFTKGYNRAYYR